MDETPKTPEQPADVVLKVHDSFIGQTGMIYIPTGMVYTPIPPPAPESEVYRDE